MDFWKIEAGKGSALIATGELLPDQDFGWLDLTRNGGTIASRTFRQR
jgi:hypothetical protein